MTDKEKRVRPGRHNEKDTAKDIRPADGKYIRTGGRRSVKKIIDSENNVALKPSVEARIRDEEDKSKIVSDDFDPILTSGALEMEIPLSGESIAAFKTYAKLLKEWNEKMNLTGIVDDSGIALRHFVDSLTLVPFLRMELRRGGTETLSLIDIGTGAGFPGIPIKVAMPSLCVTLLDSLGKRVKFLETVCAELQLGDIDAIHSRAEDAGRSKIYREKYDVATARAVAPLNVLCEYCLPFVRVGGIFLSMKGNVDEEARSAEKAVITMGGTIEDLAHFTLPGTDMNRTIIVIRKIRPTPAKYPRTAGKPEKEPII